MRRYMTAAGLGLLVLTGAARAGGFTAAPHSTYLLDLDTPDQHMSAWRLDELTSINALRTTATVHRLGSGDGDIKPGFLLNFVNGTERVAIYILGNPRDQKLAVTLLHTRGNKDVGDGGVFLGGLLLGVEQPFDLAVDWTPDGKMTATLSGKETLSAQMAKPPTQLEVNGTGGEIEFKALVLGTSSP